MSGLACADTLDGRLNERVVMLPVVSHGARYELETTIFTPPGSGPFPLLLLNHGKSLGEPHSQGRDRFLAISSQFVSRGYAVVIPMRGGFARSGGSYDELDCNMDGNGQLQADDVQGALQYLQTQSWVDKNRIVVAGQSYGGLAALALGTRDVPGVRGLINFAGGLRVYGSACNWQASLIDAFRNYGKHTSIPSIWFYGENDHHFSPELVQQLYRAYVESNPRAELVAFGRYRNDAHGMGASWGGVQIWWPETEKFLRSIGMPTAQTVMLAKAPSVSGTNFAPLDDTDALPYLDAKGRAAYRQFLAQPLPRAFAVSSSGAWSWAEDGDDPQEKVLADCQKASQSPCHLYAIDDSVVWAGEQQRLAAVTKPGNS